MPPSKRLAVETEKFAQDADDLTDQLSSIHKSALITSIRQRLQFQLGVCYRVGLINELILSETKKRLIVQILNVKHFHYAYAFLRAFDSISVYRWQVEIAAPLKESR